MRSSVQLGGDTLIWWVLILLAPLFLACNRDLPDDINPSPVATPIVVGSPSPETPSASPTAALTSKEERHETLEQVERAIKEARKAFPGETAVYFIDMESDLELNFDGEKRFESASLMKLVVIAELYRLIQVGKLELDHPLVLKQEQIVGGSGDLKDMVPGMTFTIRVLAEKMITQSDNTATQMLTDFITKDALNKSTKNLGLPGTTVNRDIYDFAAIDRGLDNYITAKDAAHLMEQLARDELPGSEEIHAILERQQRNDMLGSGPQQKVRLAHKTGELTGILHDVGVVYAPRGAYVLALLSDKVDDNQQAVKVWANLAQEILKIYQSQSPSPTPEELNSSQ